MDKKISRRKFLKNAVVGGVALGTGLGGYRVTYGQAKKATGPIKIGGQGAVSGAHTDYGWQMMAGSTMAIEEINAKGGITIKGAKHPIKIEASEIRDGAPGVPVPEALLGIEKIILDKKVHAIVVGPFRSEALMATMDLLAKYKVPMPSLNAQMMITCCLWSLIESVNVFSRLLDVRMGFSRSAK